MLNKLPFYIESLYYENGNIFYECTTKELLFWFTIVYNNNYVDLYFNPSIYWDSDLIQCDFNSDISRNISNELISEIDILDNDIYNTNFLMKKIFQKFWDKIHKEYIKTNIYNYYSEKYDKDYWINYNTIIDYLCNEKNVFGDINKWAKNCYAVSMAIYPFIKEQLSYCDKVKKVEVVYGKWLWYTSENSVFECGVSNHWWLEITYDKKVIVIDPTRWVFEDIEPYIYINIKTDEYDRAWQEFQIMMRQNKTNKIPEEIPDDDIIDISFWKDIDIFIYEKVLENKHSNFTKRNLLYIANTPIKYLWWYEKTIMNTLIDNWFRAFIPVDTYELVYWFLN